MSNNAPPTTGLSGEFRIAESAEKVDGSSVLTLSGQLDADAAPILAAELERRLLAGQRIVHLDFSGVSFISSSGVGSLIASVGEYRDENGEIIIHALNEDLLHVFEMLGLMDYVEYRA